MLSRYACFISYRHGQRKLAERIVTDLYEALSSEIELLRNEEIYLDRSRLEGGNFYNEALAQALCKSVCMIMIFTPTYFDKLFPYCAREYKAMEKLEEQRLKLMEERFKLVGKSIGKNYGLIIPIVFRGEEYLPPVIKRRRQYYSFDDFLLCDVEMGMHPGYAPKIKQIAKYIADRCVEFEVLSEVLGECDNFTLPGEEEIVKWLDTFWDAKIPFPGR
jgi:hypothetical protein